MEACTQAEKVVEYLRSPLPGNEINGFTKRPDAAILIHVVVTLGAVPPYVGPSGWVGIWLDGVADWGDVAEFVRDSYRLIAPKKQSALLAPD
jgi:hypothetical protein